MLESLTETQQTSVKRAPRPLQKGPKTPLKGVFACRLAASCLSDVVRSRDRRLYEGFRATSGFNNGTHYLRKQSNFQ